MYQLTDITKKKISAVFQISDVTISKTYRRIYPFHNIVMNNTITNLVTEKRNQIPKKKIDITKDNLVVSKDINEDTNLSSIYPNKVREINELLINIRSRKN